MKILKIEKSQNKPVYDIEIEGAEHYILENGIISHNSGTKYAASVTIFLSKAQYKEGEERLGNILTCTL
jgi:hypothetical protein